MGMRKQLAAALTIGVVLIGFVGACSRAGNEDSGLANMTSADESSGAGGSAATAKAEAFGPTATAAAAVADAGTGGGALSADAVGAPLPQGIGAPRIIKTATVEIEVPKGRFDSAFSKVPTIAAALGGFVSSSTSSQADQDDTQRQAAGSVVLRVPAEQFESARTQLIALGELRRQELKGDDVSAQLTDLDARLRNLRSQEEAIRLLMTKTKTIGETIEVQRQLGAVREQIEQLAAEQARLGDAVALSTITLHLSEPGAVASTEADEPSPIAEAFRTAVTGAQNVLAGVIVTVGYLLPLALLLAAGWLIARPFLARRNQPTPAPATTTS